MAGKLCELAAIFILLLTCSVVTAEDAESDDYVKPDSGELEPFDDSQEHERDNDNVEQEAHEQFHEMMETLEMDESVHSRADRDVGSAAVAGEQQLVQKDGTADCAKTPVDEKLNELKPSVRRFFLQQQQHGPGGGDDGEHVATSTSGEGVIQLRNAVRAEPAVPAP